MPGEWRDLGELFSLEYGSALLGEKRSGLGFPVFGSSGIVGFHHTHSVNGPGIVVGRKGSIGAVFWSQQNFWPIDTAYFVQPKTSIDLRWLYWVLKALPLNRLDTSTGVPGLNRNDVARLSAYTPPLPEQRRVAEILDTLDTVIERTEQVIAKLKAARTGLLHDLLTRGLDEQGQLRDPERNPEQFKDTELGRVPRAWAVQPLGEALAAKEYGVSVPLVDEGHISVLRMNNIQEEEFDVSDLKYSSSPKATGLPMHVGDVLFNRTNSIEHVGKSAIWRGQLKNTSFASYMVRLVPKSDILLSDFLVLWLNYKSTRIRVKRYSTPAVQQVNVNPTSLGKVVMGIPSSILEQRQIVETLEEFRQRVHTEQLQLAKLQALKQGLMEDLLTGRVRLPVSEGAAS